MSSLSHRSNAEPNLTPILDMVFQLITFFMLVINFKAASMDMDLKLPVVGSARPVDMKGGVDLLILNVNSKGELRVYGQIKNDVPGYIAKEAQASLLVANRNRRLKSLPELKFGEELDSTVVIRADRRTPFKLLNDIIVVCQTNGYHRFALKAKNQEE